MHLIAKHSLRPSLELSHKFPSLDHRPSLFQPGKAYPYGSNASADAGRGGPFSKKNPPLVTSASSGGYTAK